MTINESYVVTGGTGAFLDATGEIDEMGLAVSTGTSAITNYTFEGTIAGPKDLIATPELGFASLLLGNRFPHHDHGDIRAQEVLLRATVDSKEEPRPACC